MITQSYKYFYKRFLQYVALFSSNLASQRETIRQNAKAPEAGQACFEGIHGKFYFAFGPKPYFFR